YGQDGTLLARWGPRGADLGEVRSPSGLAIAPDGTIYVSDYRLDRIYKLGSDWRLLDTWGGSGVGEGRLYEPSDLALDVAGNVFVAEYGNGRIQQFGPAGDVRATFRPTTDSNDRSGRTIGAAVSVDAQGRVYTLGDGDKIVRLLPDGRTDLE